MRALKSTQMSAGSFQTHLSRSTFHFILTYSQSAPQNLDEKGALEKHSLCNHSRVTSPGSQPSQSSNPPLLQGPGALALPVKKSQPPYLCFLMPLDSDSPLPRSFPSARLDVRVSLESMLPSKEQAAVVSKPPRDCSESESAEEQVHVNECPARASLRSLPDPASCTQLKPKQAAAAPWRQHPRGRLRRSEALPA